MKHLIRFFTLTTVLLAATALQSAEVPWWTFTGGGGIAQNGLVAIGGAIGPIAPALSPATGGNYTLTGGFWSALPGQPKTAAPVLSIKSLGAGMVMISWPLAVNGYILEYSAQLVPGAWFTEPVPVLDTPTEHTVIVLAQSDFRCYRLHRK